ncbi:MAG: GDP-mannose 4,6-dehydratase [Rhodobacteraceae bacterium]|nr:GDP-mannose 4,6-dehydratase [Paracoccaceae bacterium]
MTKSIIVLGSNSPSAANFCAYALDRGYEVIATSRSPEKEKVFLPYAWGSRKTPIFEQIDLNRDIERLAELMRKHRPAYVVNFASQAMVAQSWENPSHWMQTNVVAMANLLELLRNADYLERYVHFSTPEVYGSTDGWIVENRNYNPSTPYALSRAAGDMSTVLWSETYDLPTVITRAANVYGEGQQLYRIIPRTFLCCFSNTKLSLHGGGLSERAFVHFDDISDGVMRVCENGQSGEDYHMSPKDSVTIRALVEKICAIAGAQFSEIVELAPDRLGKDQAYLLDSTKISTELGWSPQLSLEAGLERCAEWCKNNLEELLLLPQSYEHKP